MKRKYLQVEELTKEIFALLNPPEIENQDDEEPCFYWEGFFINWEQFIAEHSMLLDFRIEVSDKKRIYSKLARLFKI